MPIRILSDEIASQIAAGEVVERPASVVKELVENALDAGATHIRVLVEDAGKRLIEVADNGNGIPAEELPLAVARHATSKLESAQDLFRIATLGFRGEALASIASVSRLTLTSRPRAAESGHTLQVDAGVAGPLRPVGAPAGTVVRVENLFYNVPARLKFLKADRTERRHILDLLTRYALAYPQVRFHLQQEGRAALQSSGNGDRREALAHLFGPAEARQMIEVVAQYDDLEITGFVSPPGLTRSNRSGLLFFVNGRPVRDAALTSALLRAYHTLLMVGRYPLAALFLKIPPQQVDVNVHPAKAEVRFRDKDAIFRGVGRAVHTALLAHTPVPDLPSLGGEARLDAPAARLSTLWGAAVTTEASASSSADARADGFAQPPLPAVTVPLLRLVGQLAGTYLVAEGPDGLYLVDQHAAHERVLFERFMAQRGEGIPAQQLMEPVVVELPPAAAEVLSEQLPTLSQLGFDVEAFGRGAFLLRAIPAMFQGMDPQAALRVLVEDFEEDETPLAEEVEARIIARVCKRAAVKGGQILSPDEQQALLRDLEACQSPRTCPHGRPTMIHLSVDMLERQFGRRGAR